MINNLGWTRLVVELIHPVIDQIGGARMWNAPIEVVDVSVQIGLTRVSRIHQTHDERDKSGSFIGHIGERRPAAVQTGSVDSR